MFKLDKRSMDRLQGVHPDLVKVVQLAAIEISDIVFTVLEGVRTRQRQAELYAQGRTSPGKIVTWTMNSAHIPKQDGFGHAVDLVPYPLDWNSAAKFDAIAKAMFAAARDLSVEIRWGADWDQDGVPRERGESDSPHFELDRRFYP